MFDSASSLTVRPARRSDLTELIRLCAAHAAYEKAEYDPVRKMERLEELLFAPPCNLFCFVAESPINETNGLVGYLTWSCQISTWDATTYAYMDCLYLDPEARGYGLGRLLVGQMVGHALEMGCTRVQWQTPVFNTQAMRFYNRLGANSLEKVRYFLDETAMVRLLNEVNE